MPGISFYIKTDYDSAKNMAEATLASHGFTLEYIDPYNCTAERGSKTATMLAGAFAGKKNQHLVLSLNYSAWDQGGQVFNICTANTGMAAGVIGVSRLQDAFTDITNTLRNDFTQNGVYTGEAPY